jgi:transposase
MSMGTRDTRQRQHGLWIAVSDLPLTAAHPFYERVNARLDAHDFDAFVEGLCQPFYARTMGRPGLAPGIYFRLLMAGYFERVDAERASALTRSSGVESV